MKKWTPVMITTVILALVIWVGYYLLFPDYPLNPQETLLVVCVSAVTVVLVKWFAKKYRKEKPTK